MSYKEKTPSRGFFLVDLKFEQCRFSVRREMQMSLNFSANCDSVLQTDKCMDKWLFLRGYFSQLNEISKLFYLVTLPCNS